MRHGHDVICCVRVNAKYRHNDEVFSSICENISTVSLLLIKCVHNNEYIFQVLLPNLGVMTYFSSIFFEM